ncbi:MAG: hypothetical protein B7Z12_22205 [Caulobacter vibrioides]|uniref:Uncharacterized protein n=1 Tax=Caulobacter vibrioides TaxID=155892 RepID=A0A258CNU1_CAUVI|nr:MAG: hypothetical protein B7Z12_22205 [Caulobacter vibrioides]
MVGDDAEPGAEGEDAREAIIHRLHEGERLGRIGGVLVLHSPDYSGQSTISVGNSWGLTSTLDVLKDIAGGKGPAKWLAALGYTGWGAGQLEGEMTRHGWQTAPGDAALLFDTALDRRWPAAFGTLGIDVSHLSAVAGRA